MSRMSSASRPFEADRQRKPRVERTFSIKIRFDTSFSTISIVDWRVPGVAPVGECMFILYHFIGHHERAVREEGAIGNVNENVEPCPKILSTATSPPCNSINFLAMVRPRPVPPKRRVVLPSACRNASKI